MKIGDRYQFKNKYNIPSDNIIWEIYQNVKDEMFLLRWEKTQITQWVSVDDLDKFFIKDDQYQLDLDWFMQWEGNKPLPKGSQEQIQCAHDWRTYHGLNFSDEYCVKCKITRPLVNK